MFIKSVMMQTRSAEMDAALNASLRPASSALVVVSTAETYASRYAVTGSTEVVTNVMMVIRREMMGATSFVRLRSGGNVASNYFLGLLVNQYAVTA